MPNEKKIIINDADHLSPGRHTAVSGVSCNNSPLYGVYQDVIAGHDFTLSATAIHYEVGGTYRGAQIWDCPDKEEIDIICNYDTAPCNYAICAFDRLTGDKLMKLYDDGSFRPAEIVTVESAEETVFHFTRSFEKDPVTRM